MKRVKFIIISFMLLLCVLMGGELAQNSLDTFTDDLYYFDISMEDTTDRMEICLLLTKLSNKNNISVFCVEKHIENPYESTITIYVTEESKAQLAHKKDIQNGIYNSLFSGRTEIVLVDFREVVSKPSIERYYFFGNTDSVRNVRNSMYERYATSYIHKDSEVSNNWMLVGIWTVLGLLYMVLTWFDIQFQKKENFILISLGVNRYWLMIKNVIIDLIIFCILFLGIRICLNSYTIVNYLDSITIPICVIIILLNSLLYFSMLRYNYKQVLYGANMNATTLSNCYVLKVFSIIIAMLVLSSNVMLITENGKYLIQYKDIETFNSYKFITVNRNMNVEDPYEVKLETARNKIFFDQYKKGNTAFSVSGFRSNSGYDYLLCNQNSLIFLNTIEEVEKISYEKDFYILIPINCQNPEEITEEAIESVSATVMYNTSELTFEVIEYGGNHQVMYFDSTDTNSLTGFAMVGNPVIVLCSFNNTCFPQEINEDSAQLGNIFGDIMFNLTDEELANLSEQYDLSENGLYITSSTVMERCNYYKTTIERIVLLNTVISIFMLILELVLIFTIVKMEFMVRATELAIKRVLGYSFFKRSQIILLLNSFSVLLGLMTVFIISVMFSFSQWYIVLMVGFLLSVLEIVILYGYIAKFEKANIPKILKGGCL